MPLLLHSTHPVDADVSTGCIVVERGGSSRSADTKGIPSMLS